MKQFELVLKNEKERSYIRFSWLIIIANLSLFVYISALHWFKNLGPLLYVLLAIIAIVVIHYSKEQKGKLRLYIVFLIIILGWINTRTYWWAGILIFVFMILDGIARRELTVKVFADKIIYPSWPDREIKWKELSNVILKDRILTIDFKSDKLIQQLIDEKNTTIDEKEFNDFCKQQLNK
jgi:hypothetical protein